MATIGIAAAYVGYFTWRRWVPWDDGILAQAAERVLHGQVPHRDFNEGYTGGLTWLHAAAFRFLGVSLASLRTTLFAFTVASVPVWYYVCRRLASPLTAAVLTLTCVVWSVPNYPASMPSWYNLFFAMAAIAALFRYVEKRTMRWVFIAGLCVGLSIATKIVGVYLAAAILLFLVFQCVFGNSPHEAANARRSAVVAALLLLLAAACAIFPVLLTLSGDGPSSANPLVTLGLPPALMAVAVMATLVSRWRSGWRPGPRFVSEFVSFGAGAAVVLLLLAVPYIASGATGALISGVFLRAEHRLQVQGTQLPGPDLFWTVCSLPLSYALVRPTSRDYAPLRTVLALVVFWMAADFAAFSRFGGMLLWLSVRMLILPLAVLVAWYVWKLSSKGEPPANDAKRLVLVACVATWCSLVQFPFTYRTYFAYVAPLVILTAIAFAQVTRRPEPALRLVTLCGYCVVALIMRPRIYPERPADVQQLTELRLPRGGISVPASDAERYEAVAALLHAHARGRYTLATPDLPEVYFLSGLENPSRTFFERFDYPPSAPFDVLRQIDADGITAIVVNHEPPFSRPLSSALEDSLVHRFPEWQSVGPLEVRWQRLERATAPASQTTARP